MCGLLGSRNRTDAYWNASGHMEDGNWDGVAYDGRLLYGPAVTPSGRVWFQYEDGSDRYFELTQLTRDPRLTNWWMAFCADPAGSLQQTVAEAALSQHFPDITTAIIQHMVTLGVVESGKTDRLTKIQIRQAMLAYTDLALVHNERATREAVGTRRLTEKRFFSARAGDTLCYFYKDRFGPLPRPVDRQVVRRRVQGGLAMALDDGDLHTEFTLTWRELKPYAPYIALARNR